MHRSRDAIAGVIQAMSAGESLVRSHERGTTNWCLTPSGRPISSAIAILVIGDPRIVAGGDGLFEGLDQTWRLAE
jgi:hypothetical protein